MAEILPFRGIRYDRARCADLGDVVSPPYDVIDDDLRERLYARSAYNIVRIDYGKPLEGDNAENNRYLRARAQFDRWSREGVLIQESRPALYYLEEDYRGEFGSLRTRRGFVSAVRLEDPESGVYRPHERTFEGPKADRLELMRACRANTSPVFSLYDDPGGGVLGNFDRVRKERRPDFGARNDEGVDVRVWVVSDPEVINGVTQGMRGKSFFIADGHHRYETALNYRRLMARSLGRDAEGQPWNSVMMYVSSLWDAGLTILPTHRAIAEPWGCPVEEFIERCRDYFEVEVLGGDVDACLARMKACRGKKHAFGFAARGSEGLWLLTLRRESAMDDLFAENIPEVVRRLDVTVLHSLVLERLMGLHPAGEHGEGILRFLKDPDDLVGRVHRGELEGGFLLNPTRVEEVKAVAEQGYRMPQKSTFFYPKLITGLVLNPLF